MSREFLSCDGLGCSPSQMISGVLQSYSKLPDWLQFEDRESIFTHQGRNAIALICQLLHIGSGDEVLVPAYNCGAEVDPFVCAGAKLVFYRIDNKATIDTEDIIRRVTPATRIVYVTHYFGWPQEIDELAKWCKDKGLFLLEDCALSLFSKGSDNTVGRTGDAAIYSFVKSLPVPDGGALVINKDVWNETKTFRPPRHRSIILNSLPLLKKWFMHTTKFWQHYEFTRQLLSKSWLRKPSGQDCEIKREMPQSNYFDEQKIDRYISRLSKGILNTTNPEKIVEKRRRNYQYLNKALFNIPALQPLFDDLPNNVCPLSFPALVEDRSRWCKALNANGILAYEWWAGYHRGFDWDEYPEACNLKDNLLTLPVHQDLDINHMEYIAGCVKQIAGEIYKSNPC